MSTDAHAEAIKTFLATATKAPVYDFDEGNRKTNPDGSPFVLPEMFTIVHLERRFGDDAARLDGIKPTPLRRLYTRAAAKTVTNVRLIEDRTADAFEFATVNLGDTTAHFAFETGGGSFEQSEGFFVRTSAWTYSV